MVTQPNPSEFKGFSAICTHQNCTVSRVEGGTIDCLCHGSKFSSSTARSTRPRPRRRSRLGRSSSPTARSPWPDPRCTSRPRTSWHCSGPP
ncbi:Rieske 2Fe-2S domain-containing protein [Micromonospora sp. DPT]|uniref:Rieske 2Fe-2S domain-containing protein n=1 Tax=Micromonospora sp. DPT TaxID=3142975 RepID=UPI0032083C4F